MIERRAGDGGIVEVCRVDEVVRWILHKAAGAGTGWEGAAGHDGQLPGGGVDVVTGNAALLVVGVGIVAVVGDVDPFRTRTALDQEEERKGLARGIRNRTAGLRLKGSTGSHGEGNDLARISPCRENAAGGNCNGLVIEDVDEAVSGLEGGGVADVQRLGAVLADRELTAGAAVGVGEDYVACGRGAGKGKNVAAGQQHVDGVGGDGEVWKLRAVSRGNLGILNQAEAAGSSIDAEHGDVAAGGGAAPEDLSAWGVRGGIVVEHDQVLVGGVFQNAVWVQPLGKERALLGEDSVSAYSELNDIRLGAWRGGGAVCAARV